MFALIYVNNYNAMELLTNPKTEYLLEVSLSSLHAESVAWLKEIDFWKDEMAFFYRLLHQKDSSGAFPAKDIAAIEQELVRINSDKVDKAGNEVQKHERMLASVLETSVLQDEENYRKAHRELFEQVYEAHQVIRRFKRDVFAFFKKHPD